MTQMTEDPKNSQPEAQDPIIPPSYLLGLSFISFLVAAFVALTQAEFSVVGIGALVLGVLALVLWVVLAPDQARGTLTGRTARYGGTSLLITLLLIVALVFVYVAVRSFGARIDLTERNDFSLTTESRQAITALGADPSLPRIKLVGFYSSQQIGLRDQGQPLLQDYATTSGGKIEYEFVDPDLQPGLVQSYSVTTNGQIVVAAIDSETGELDLENAERVSSASQEELTNAILSVAAQGNFRAYFITVADGESEGMASLKDTLTSRFDWTVEEVTLIELTNPESTITLNDPNIDGEVMIIPGGSQALSEQELAVLTNYLNAGGNVILFAGTNLNDDRTSLATDSALTTYLAANFGISVLPDVVFDTEQAFQSPIAPVVNDFDTTSFITTNGIPPGGQAAAVFELTNSLALSQPTPANVTVTALARTSASSFSKSDIEGILSGTVTRADTDPTGPLVVMAQAENSQTGARLVVMGSTAPALDTFSVLNVDNLSLTFNSLVWVTDFVNYFQDITVLQQQRPQDQPMFASEATLATATGVVTLLPFAVLFVGIYVWWSNRPRAR